MGPPLRAIRRGHHDPEEPRCIGQWPRTRPLSMRFSLDSQPARHGRTRILRGRMEKTFAIIKPDAVAAKNAGEILARIEAEGFRVVAFKRRVISKAEAESFYGEHSAKGFFGALVAYIDRKSTRLNSSHAN